MKILFFGDSITAAGRDVSAPSDLGSGYVKILAGKLQPLYEDITFTFINRGIDGDSTKDLLARIETDVVSESPDIVVLEVGINDVYAHLAEPSRTAEEFCANYDLLVEKLAEGRKLILVQPFLLKRDVRPRATLNVYNEVIRGIAAREKLPLIPMDEIFRGVTQDISPEQFAADGIHPTHRGCRYIADCIIKELKKQIG